jgi:hypothetical protein
VTSHDVVFHRDPWRATSTDASCGWNSAEPIGNDNADEVWSKWKGIMCEPPALGKTKCYEGDRVVEVGSCLVDRAPKHECDVEEPRNAPKYWASNPAEVGVKGDWRALPQEDFHILHDRFPSNPFTMTPSVYVKQRWPSYHVLLNAAVHWKQYGPSATLPSDLYQSADATGCKTELETLREVFRDARVAGVRDWR